MRAFILVLLVLAMRPPAASAQQLPAERELVVRGMNARLTRGGVWPPKPSDVHDTTIALYPAVRFYYADVALQDGGTFRLYSAVDSAGQLYLLDSPASFRLLHQMYFRGTVDSASAVTIALLASRFGGLLPSKYELREVKAFLMRTAGTSPWAWNVRFEVAVGGTASHLEYWVRINDGTPLLMSRDCGEWCRTTILEP